MESTNFNRQVRSSLTKSLDNYVKISNLPLNVCIDLYMELYFANDEPSNELAKFYRVYLNSVLYLDAYKMYVYKQKENMFNADDLTIFNMLINLTEYNELENALNSDINFLKACIKASYDFNNLPGLAKINVLKSLSEEENEWLLEKFQVHQFDLDAYDKEIKLEDITKNMVNTYKYQKSINEECLDAIVVGVLGFIKNMFKLDGDNAYKLLLEIGKQDYEINKSLEDKCEDSDVLDHIDLYENYDIDQIMNVLTSNDKYLTDALWALLEKNLFNKYKDVKLDGDTKVSEDTIKKFIIK